MRRSIALLVTASLATAAAAVAVTVLGPTSRAGAVEDYPAPAGGTFTFTGHGNGHGIGLSQYGARNAAALGRSGTQILDFYYPETTTVAEAASLQMRVRLMAASASEVPVQGATGLAVRDAATGLVTPLPDASARYRIVADATALRVQSSTDGGASWSELGSGTGPLVFQGVPELRLYLPDGTSRGYQGTIAGVRSGETTLVTVNTVGIDAYVAGAGRARSGGTAIGARLAGRRCPVSVRWNGKPSPSCPAGRVGQLGQGGRVGDGVGVGVPVASAAAVPVALPVASAAADDVGVPAAVATPLGVCVPDDVGVGLGVPLGVGVQVGDGDGAGLVLVGLPLGVGVPGVLGDAVGVVGVLVGVVGGVLGGAGLDGRVGGAGVVGFGLPGARGVVVPGAAGGSPCVAGGSVGSLIGVDPLGAEPSIGTPPAYTAASAMTVSTYAVDRL